MAFQNVKNNGPSEKIKANDLKLGESITAFAVRPDVFTDKDGQTYYNLIMQKEDGSQFKLQTCGSLSYDVKDGRIKPGRLTQITKTANRGGAVTRTQFEVLQDPDMTIPVSDSDDSSFSAITSSSEMRSNESSSNAIRQATERASVKAQAARLSAQVTNKKQGA